MSNAQLSAVQRAEPILVIGAGSWGTALAIQFARAGRQALLWGRDFAHLQSLERERVNHRYLPDAPFPAALRVELDLIKALAKCQDILIAVPSHALRSALTGIAEHVRAG